MIDRYLVKSALMSTIGEAYPKSEEPEIVRNGLSETQAVELIDRLQKEANECDSGESWYIFKEVMVPVEVEDGKTYQIIADCFDEWDCIEDNIPGFKLQEKLEEFYEFFADIKGNDWVIHYEEIIK